MGNSLYRNVACRAVHAGANPIDIPGAVGWTEDGNISLAIASVIADDWNVAHSTIYTGPNPIQIPGAIGGTEDCYIGLAIAVIVSHHGNIASLPTCRVQANLLDAPNLKRLLLLISLRVLAKQM
jgi:hypothetical protein